MSNIIYLTPDRIAQAQLRAAGRHLATPRLSVAERVHRRKHARRMLAFAAKSGGKHVAGS